LASAFRKLLGLDKNRSTASGEVPTIPLAKTAEQPAQETIPADRLQPENPRSENPRPDHPQPEIGFGYSVGRQRDHNEDSLLVVNSSLATNGEVVPFGLYIVADGMGGHKQGEVASGLAIRTIASEIVSKIMLALLAPQPEPPEESLQEIMEHSLQEAHRAVMKEAPGSGTTLTAVLNLENRLTIAHVGDSRAIAIHPDGTLLPLTRDHSLVMRMMEMGQLTEEEAAVHPQRNVLYRALGQGESFAPDVTTSPLPEAGYLLLCSDGLWGLVLPEEIAQIVTTTSSVQSACQKLVNAANEAGGPDNITVVLIRLPE
jgi:protein phosphatase